MKIKLGFILFLYIIAVSLTAQTTRSDSIVRVGACATPGSVFGVHVQGDYAYIADGGRLTVVNVSDSSNPYVVSNLVDIDVHPVGVFVRDTVVYNNNGLYATFSTVSIADPVNPYKLGWCFRPNPTPQPKGIDVLDTIAYLANTQEVYLLNIVDPDSPNIIIGYSTPGYAFDLRIKDTLLYIADYDSLQIANVALPDNPFRVGAYGIPTGCWDVDIKNNHAYIACQSTFGTDGRLISVDISNPVNPLLVDEVYMNADPIAVFVEGNYAYVAAADYWASKGKQKRDPFEMRSRNHPDSKADVEGGLRIVDISQPDSLKLVTSYDTPGCPEDVFAVGNLAYIADGDSLQILKHIIAGIFEQELTSRGEQWNTGIKAYPNPFATRINIQYVLWKSTNVDIKIYSVDGRIIRTLHTGLQEAGRYALTWDGKTNKEKIAKGGVYFCRLECDSRVKIQKLIWID